MMSDPVMPNPDAVRDDEPAGLGHNNPPPYDLEQFAGLTKTADEFLKACNVWQKTDVDSDTLAEQLTDQIAGLRANLKAVEEARKAAKKPHDDAGKAVQAAFLPLKERYDRALKVMNGKSADWLQKKRAEEEEKKRQEREEARRAEEQARLAAMEAEESGDIDAQLEAENLEKDAAKKTKAAAKPVKVSAKSASGAGRTVSLRKRRFCTVTNASAAFLRYRQHPKMIELLEQLANQEANAKGFEGDIPGFKIEEKETAA